MGQCQPLYIDAMFFRQFYDHPLAQASYLLGCQQTGEAIVVDPNRDIAQYIDVAAAEGLQITHVTETHIHADFVSGVRELASATRARMFLSAEGGPEWQYRFAEADGATLIGDGDAIMVGNIRLTVMHSPGHTPEHLAFIVEDTPRAAGAMGVLTGDFVFVGDVGRPDLLERAAGYADTMEAGARTLFRSLERFRALPDHLQVWPGHGAGSACGKSLGAVPSSTVGYEKRSNWGVAETDESAFVANVLDGQPEPPRYFAEMKRINREGPPILHRMPTPAELSADTIIDLAEETWLIDLRPTEASAMAHIPGALTIAYGKSFSTFAGTVVPYDVDTVLVTSATDASALTDVGVPSRVLHAAHDLAMIGLDRIRGWIAAESALSAWHKSGHKEASTVQVSVDEFDQWPAAPMTIVDVRGEGEWREDHLPNALHVPLGSLVQRMGEIPDGPVLFQCQGGSRSAIAASLFKRFGRPDARNFAGGFDAWRAAHRLKEALNAP